MFGLTFADVIKTAITASINAIAVYFSVRYVGRITDHIEKAAKTDAKKDQQN